MIFPACGPVGGPQPGYGTPSKAQFIVLHVGNFSEDLANVSQNLDRFPNMTVDTPRELVNWATASNREKNFSTSIRSDPVRNRCDAHGDEFPQQVFNDELYEIYYRFLETDDEYFDYASGEKCHRRGAGAFTALSYRSRFAQSVLR